MSPRNGWVLTVALATLCGLFSGCTSQAGLTLSGPIVEAPRWEAGYRYDYDFRGSGAVNADFMGEAFNESFTLPSADYFLEVLNTTMVLDGEPVYLTASSLQTEEIPVPDDDFPSLDYSAFLPPNGLSVSAYRHRDLGLQPTRMDCELASCALNVAESYVDAPDITYLDFPLQKNKQWSASFTFEDDEFGEFLGTAHSKVLGVAREDVLGEPTEVMLVQQTVRTAPSAAALSNLKAKAWQDDQVNIKSLEVLSTIETTLAYADDLGIVSRSDTAIRSTFNAEITSEEEDASIVFEYALDLSTTLRGATLEAGPERDLDYARKVLEGAVPVERAGDEAIAVTIGSTKDRVNAEAREYVEFGAVIQGTLPEAASLTWQLVDADGAIVVEREGASFEHEFDEPGAYTIMASVKSPSGATLASAQRPFIADYVFAFTEGCTVAGVEPVLDGCSAFSFPVRPGVTHLEVRAQPSSLAGPTGPGRLVVMDAEGEATVVEEETNGEYVLAIDDFSKFAINQEDWSMEWYQDLGIAETADYSVRSWYGPVPTEPEVVASEPSGPARVDIVPLDLPLEWDWVRNIF